MHELCVGYDHSSRGTKGQDQGLKSGGSQFKTRSVGPPSSI